MVVEVIKVEIWPGIVNDMSGVGADDFGGIAQSAIQ